MFQFKNKDIPTYSKVGVPILKNNVKENIILNGKSKDALSGKWILKQNKDAKLEVKDNIPSITIGKCSPDTVIYLRSIANVQCTKGKIINCQIQLLTSIKKPLSITVSIFEDAELQNEINTSTVKGQLKDSSQFLECDVEVARSGEFYILFQINFFPDEYSVVVNNVEATLLNKADEFRPIRFGMRSFGPYEKASARLRCWKVAETLKQAGHMVSVNSGASSDIVFYQKVKDIKHFKSIKNKESRLFVFDFDDNYFMPNKGNPAELLSFMNQMDIVTVGSQYLYDIAKDYHPNLIVLENPTDIISDTVVKQSFKWNRNLGWFGAPENVLQLELVDCDEKITTITRGGDIEFDIYTVDELLTEFDLLLFPLEITDWNAAKNANRMIKAVSLGIPVLASATPEHIRVMEQFGLSDEYLVFEGDSWQSKIIHIKENYKQVQSEIALARVKALEIYSIESITKKLFIELFKLGKRDPAKNKCSASNLSKTALISMSFSIMEQNFEDFLNHTEIDLSSFSSVRVYGDYIDKNKFIEHGRDVDFTLNENPLALFEDLDSFIENTNDEYILLTNSNVSLLKPLIKDITFDQDVLGIDLSVFEGGLHDFPKNNLEAHKVLLNKQHPKSMLVKISWLKNKKIKASEMLSYFPMAIWYEALICNSTSTATTDLPLGVLYKVTQPVNISNIFYRNILRNEPEFKTEIPNIENQWARTSHDIVQTILSRQPQAAASIGAKLLQSHYANMAKGEK